MASARAGNELKSVIRLLCGLAVLGVLVGLAGIFVPVIAGEGGESAQTKAVAAQARKFAIQYNTYTIDDLADYQKRMKPLLTKEYYTEFTKVTDAIFGALEDKNQQSGSPKVLSVAVDALDDEQALVLVAVDSQIKTTQDEAAVQRRFRWRVTFENESGVWKVSQFEAIAPLDAVIDTPAASSTPSATASGEATR